MKTVTTVTKYKVEKTLYPTVVDPSILILFPVDF